MTAPVTQERLSRILDDLEINYGLDDDGDLVAAWDQFTIWLICGENFTYINALWSGKPFPEAERDAALDFVTTWNREMVSPRAVIVNMREGAKGLAGEYTLPPVEGFTDKQLTTHIGLALELNGQLADAAAKQFPHLAPTTD